MVTCFAGDDALHVQFLRPQSNGKAHLTSHAGSRDDDAGQLGFGNHFTHGGDTEVLGVRIGQGILESPRKRAAVTQQIKRVHDALDLKVFVEHGE